MKPNGSRRTTGAKPTARKKAIVAALLERHGRTYGEELGIGLARNTPPPLFQWLCASLLFSARIGARQALQASEALAKQGWTTPRKIAATSWSQRTRVLNRAGYARYDERTSRMLADTTERLLERYGGDLRKLREQAGRDPKEERRLLKEFKGIGEVGVDIFFREAQAAWDELYPFADKKALQAAGKLGLGRTPQQLAGLVERQQFPRLVTALARGNLGKELDAVKKAAA